MTIKHEQINSLSNAIAELKKNEELSIYTKYKIIKIEQLLNQESEIAYELFKEIQDKYGESGSNFNEVKIKPEYQEIVEQQLQEFNKQEIQMPDLYFTLDELGNLSWTALEALMCFIKI